MARSSRAGGVLPGRAAPTDMGDVQDHVQYCGDRQADRRPADHIQRVVPQEHPRHPVARCQHERGDPQRRGSTSSSSPAIEKLMMACPEVKLSPWCRLTFLWLSAAGYASLLTTVRVVRRVPGGA